MQVFFDNIIFSLQKVGGISVYWYELIKRLSTRLDIIHINHQHLEKNLFSKGVSEIQYFKRNELALPLFIKRFLPYIGILPKNSIFHSSYQRICLQRNVVNIVTIHDCGYEAGFMGKRWKRGLHIFFKKKVIYSANGIIAVSNSTKADLLRYYPFLDPNKIKVIYNGIGSEYQELPKLCQRPSYLPNKYVLFIGGRDAYKNFTMAVEALAPLKDFKLVIAGGRPLSENERQFLELKLPARYLFIADAPNGVLCRLYNYAHCLLYPSRYEGFGIPVAEAMRCGCPVIALKCSSIPEVAGTAAIFINKDNLQEISVAITSLLDPGKRTELIERGKKQSEKFSWERCADETLSFYHKCYEAFKKMN